MGIDMKRFINITHSIVIAETPIATNIASFFVTIESNIFIL
jgi:hypothetical protein